MTRATVTETFTLNANAQREFMVPNAWWKILAATGLVDVRRDGGSLIKGVKAGQGEQVEFSRLQITDVSGATNTITLQLADSTFIDTTFTGTVAVTANPRSTFTQGQNTVTNASANLVAANASRSYLLIQNNGTVDIWVNYSGAACTTANGIKIAAGGSAELAAGVPPSAITAIVAAASNLNVVVVEG